MRIALLESSIKWEDKIKNIETLKKALVMLEGENIDLICLPEMSFTGFSMNIDVTKDVNKETLNTIKSYSVEYDTVIGFGWVEVTDGKGKNHYTIVGKQGIILDYVKIHPFSYLEEDKYFSSGNKLSAARIYDFCVGVQICYDLRFPEPFQALSNKTDLIIVPANWPAVRDIHWKTLLNARAIENQVYIAGVNCAGMINGTEYMGHSVLVNPDGSKCSGRIIGIDDNNKAFVYDIDNDVKKYREEFPLKQDRQLDLYKELYNSV